MCLLDRVQPNLLARRRLNLIPIRQQDTHEQKLDVLGIVFDNEYALAGQYIPLSAG